MLVCKCGGTSVQDLDAQRRLAAIVRERLQHAPLVVVSALSGVSGGLLRVLVGRVARVGADAGGRGGMGIQLVSVDAEATELIDRLVEASLSSVPAPRG